MSLSFYTSALTTGTLGGILLNKLESPQDCTQDYVNPKFEYYVNQINTLEKYILAIATTQYIITFNMPNERLQRWRYLDWILTTPLLLKTFHSLAESQGYTESFIPAFLANLVMILSGYFAEFLSDTPEMKNFWYIVGLIALVVVLYYVNRWDTFLTEQGVDTETLPVFFYLGWSLYGLNFQNPNEELRQTGFNILDLFNKGIYSLQLDRVIKNIS